jgi:hypothetical protein
MNLLDRAFFAFAPERVAAARLADLAAGVVESTFAKHKNKARLGQKVTVCYRDKSSGKRLWISLCRRDGGASEHHMAEKRLLSVSSSGRQVLSSNRNDVFVYDTTFDPYSYHNASMTKGAWVSQLIRLIDNPQSHTLESYQVDSAGLLKPSAAISPAKPLQLA